MGKILKYGCLGTLGFLVLIVIIGAISGGGSKSPAVAVATPGAQAAAPAATPAANKEAPAPTATPAAKPTNTPRPTPTAALGTRENPAPMGVDVQVKDARWKIVKAEVKDALPATFGSPKKAQGKFVVVVAEVENLGKDMKTVTHLDLMDDQGRKFVTSSEMYDLEPEQLFLLKNLNPNMPYRFSDVFDVPKDARGLMVTVSDLRMFGATTAHVSLGAVQ